MKYFNNSLTASFLFISLVLISTTPSYQKTPVIGIISTPSANRSDTDSYIKTTYVEFVETGDATVIPIPWHVDEEKFKTLLDSVNGVLFTGGGAFLWDEDPVTGQRTDSAFQKRLNYVVDLVKKKKSQGIHFPLWAICQGFEAVGIALTGDPYILDNFVQFGKLAEVYFTPEASTSTMYQYFTQDSFDILQNNPTLYYWHEYGLNTSVPDIYPAFSSDKWTVTGISKDDNGKEFLTAMESNEFPIYMTMYHAERILFEAAHSPKARHFSGTILAIKLTVKAFLTEASKNNNKFENEELLEQLIIEDFGAVNWKTNGLYYIFNPHSLDTRWEMIDNHGSGWIIFFLIVILVAGAFFGYSKYRKQQKVGEPYLQLSDHTMVELKQNSVTRGH